MIPELNKIYHGDCLQVIKTWPDGFVNCCVTSPPYFGLRDYGVDGQIGLEKSPQEYVDKMVLLFREVRRILRDDGVFFLNLGDSYTGNCSRGSNNGRAGFGNPREIVDDRKVDGLGSKNLIGIPWRVAFALQADGWILRQDIIWAKPNAMPESVTDRCTKSHEYIFLFSKQEKYFFDGKAIQERTMDGKTQPRCFRKSGAESTLRNDTGNAYIPRDTRNKRDVWVVPVKPFAGAHFAVFPPELIIPCVTAGCPKGGVAFDPFMGSGTTALIAKSLERNYIGTELNKNYLSMAEKRIKIGLHASMREPQQSKDQMELF